MYVCFFVGGHLVQALPFVYAFLFGKLIIIIIISLPGLVFRGGQCVLIKALS